jgi:hypothetical protein
MVAPSMLSTDAGTSKLRSARRVAVTTTGSSVVVAGSACARTSEATIAARTGDRQNR